MNLKGLQRFGVKSTFRQFKVAAQSESCSGEREENPLSPNIIVKLSLFLQKLETFLPPEIFSYTTNLWRDCRMWAKQNNTFFLKNTSLTEESHYMVPGLAFIKI